MSLGPDVHICAPPGQYIGQTKMYGCRRWRTVTRKHARAETALAAAVRHMGQLDHRARVLWVGDEPCYYDPYVSMSASR